MKTTSETESGAIPLVTSIAPLAAATDAWLVDIWGVMHNGARPYLDAVRACQTFRKIGGSVMLLSNAPRPAASVAEQLDRIGVPRHAYDVILTSGDAARPMIGKIGSRLLLHIGPERDRPIFEGLNVRLAELGEAGAIVCTGLYDDVTETPDDYRALLIEAWKRGLGMVCANPDLKIERDGKIVWCAGAVAALYEELGGTVQYAGKPHGPIYKVAMEQLATLRGRKVRKERMLAIGDGIATDIAGAAAAGIRAVFIASGVHVDGDLDAGQLASLFPNAAARPVAAMPSLVW